MIFIQKYLYETIKFMPTLYGRQLAISWNCYDIKLHSLKYLQECGFNDYIQQRNLYVSESKHYMKIDATWSILLWYYYCYINSFDYKLIYNNFTQEMQQLSEYYQSIIILNLLEEFSINDSSIYSDLPINLNVINNIYEDIELNKYRKNLLNCISYYVPSASYIDSTVYALDRLVVKDLLTNEQKNKLFNNMLVGLVNDSNFAYRLDGLYASMISLFNMFSDMKLDQYTHDTLKKFIFSLKLKRRLPNVQLNIIKLLVPKLSFNGEEQKLLLRLESSKVLKTL